MKSIIISFYMLLLCLLSINASASLHPGIHFMLGGRYDDVRMCVSTPAGVKGGSIADVMLDFRYAMGDNLSVAFNLPVMRPVLFAAAFKMMQFEPQFALEINRSIKNNLGIIFSPGLGISLHYGPDYHSDTANRGESFFAAGPFISTLFGLGFPGSSGHRKVAGIRAFYIPLFSGTHENGTVLGAAVEYHISFR